MHARSRSSLHHSRKKAALSSTSMMNRATSWRPQHHAMSSNAETAPRHESSAHLKISVEASVDSRAHGVHSRLHSPWSAGTTFTTPSRLLQLHGNAACRLSTSSDVFLPAPAHVVDCSESRAHEPRPMCSSISHTPMQHFPRHCRMSVACCRNHPGCRSYSAAEEIEMRPRGLAWLQLQHGGRTGSS